MTAENSQPDNSDLPPGALLRAAREKASLSEEDVARELHITVKKVRALEIDDYEQLHSDIFIRGYLRGYAKLVDLEPEALLENYVQVRRQAGLDSGQEESPLQINIPEPRRPLWHFGLGIGLLLMVLWAVSVWFLDNRPPAGNQNVETEPGFSSPAFEPTSREAGEAERSEDEQSASEADSADKALPEATQKTEPDPVELEEPSMQSSRTLDAPADDMAPAQLPEPQSELDLLRLVFSEECWVEVVDAQGDVLETDLLLAGQSLELRGKAPFDVKLGNAQAVEVELNGEPFAFKSPGAGRTINLEVVGSED